MNVFMVTAAEMPEGFCLVVGCLTDDEFRSSDEVEFGRPMVSIPNAALEHLGIDLIRSAKDDEDDE